MRCSLTLKCFRHLFFLSLHVLFGILLIFLAYKHFPEISRLPYFGETDPMIVLFSSLGAFGALVFALLGQHLYYVHQQFEECGG